MITKSLSFFKDISRFECRNRSDFFIKYWLTQTTFLTEEDICFLNFFGCQLPMADAYPPASLPAYPPPLQDIAGDALHCPTAVIVATMVWSRVPGSLRHECRLASVTQSTAGLFLSSLSCLGGKREIWRLVGASKWNFSPTNSGIITTLPNECFEWSVTSFLCKTNWL